MISWFGLFLILLAIGAVGLYFLSAIIGLPGIHFGSVSHNCPHCGRETPSNLDTCRFCGKSFRDEFADKLSASVKSQGNSTVPDNDENKMHL